MSAAFLRIKGSDNHHDLGLIQIRTETKSRTVSPGLYHLAWQVATVEELQLAKTVLTAHNSYHGEANHGATLSIYGYDPDGIDFEIMWMLPRDSWGAYENMAVVDYLNLDEALAKWSGIATA